MLNYIFKRIGFALLALFILITLIFFIGQLIPGYPFQITANDNAETINQKLDSYGLNDNLIVQYARFWGNLITKGEFGTNFLSTESIPKLFFKVMPYTVLISGISFVIGMILGITLGIIAAVYRGRWQDTFINIFSVFFISVPSFVLATFFIRIASSTAWPIWFPSINTEGFEFGKMIQASLLPILALVISMAPSLVYYTRNEMVDVLNQDYIKTALAKGMSYSQVILKHGIRNCLIPIISVSLPMFLIVIGGSIIIERFYGVPGIADQLVKAVQQKQIYLIMFNALIISSIYYLLSIIADILYTVIDPRIKLAQSNNISIFRKFYNRFNNIRLIKKYTSWNQKQIYEIKYNSDLFKLINEKKLVNNSKKTITLTEEIAKKYAIPENKKNVIYLCNKYKIKYSNL